MAKKTKKEKTENKTKKEAEKQAKKTEPKKPGIIASILEFVQAGPISKKHIMSKLTKRFPDRDAAGMSKHIVAQLPNRMSKEKGVKIVRDKDGCFSAKK